MLGRLPARAVAVLAGIGALATVSGCASGTGASLEVRSTGASASASPRASATDDDLEAMPSAKPGGSSVQVVGPCDGGTVRLQAYPDGDGVGMTATLRNAAHAVWGVNTYVPPYDGPGGLPSPVFHTAHDGVLVIHADNLTGPDAVTGVSHAWPQSAEVDLGSKSAKVVDCGDTIVYLDARQAAGTTHDLVVYLRRAGTLRVLDRFPSAGGAWQISVTVRSPHGVQHQTQSLVPKKTNQWGFTHYKPILARFKGLTDLHQFTSVTVTASKEGTRRSWLTLSRTP